MKNKKVKVGALSKEERRLLELYTEEHNKAHEKRFTDFMNFVSKVKQAVEFLGIAPWPNMYPPWASREEAMRIAETNARAESIKSNSRR